MSKLLFIIHRKHTLKHDKIRVSKNKVTHLFQNKKQTDSKIGQNSSILTKLVLFKSYFCLLRIRSMLMKIYYLRELLIIFF